jgi:hypothetical protein
MESNSEAPKEYRAVGIVLAVSSGLFIGNWLHSTSHCPSHPPSGSSFVFKKKGLLNSQRGKTAGEGVAYLKSVCARMLFLQSSKPTLHTGAMVDRHDSFVFALCIPPRANWFTVMVLGERK